MTSNLELFPTKRKKKTTASALEWVGGRYSMPFEIEGIHPLVTLWIEMPSAKVVGTDLARPPQGEGAFAHTLGRAMKKPLFGRARRPSHVRVADPALAKELSAVHDGLEIVVQPTPEADAAFEALSAFRPPSFVEDLPPELVGEMFGAAERLYCLAPWDFIDDVVRVDIPSLGVAGACLSVMGAAGEEYGFVLFPSVAAYASFGVQEDGSIGAPLLSLSYDRKSDVFSSVLRLIEEHRWPVAGAKAYPNVELRDKGGVSLRVHERDARVLLGCTNALTAFCAMHREALAGRYTDSISESYTGDDDLTVRLTYPFEDAGLFDVALPPWDISPVRKAPAPGRNDPCHCGSGKKYKKCHLDADQKAAEPRPAVPPPVHVLDNRLMSRMLDFAADRYGEDWLPDELKALPAGESTVLAWQWAAYELPVEGRPLVEHFVASSKLTAEQTAWLASQRRAWLSIWEVLSVAPDGEVTVRDLLTGEKRTVTERQASVTLRKRDAILTRVVDHGGASYFCGLYERSLPPFDAEAVIRDVRARLRVKTGDVPVDRLRGEAAGRFMIARWAAAVDELVERDSRPPELSNTDGEALAFVIDRFSFDRKNRKAVEDRLASMDGTTEPNVHGQETIIVLLKGDTVIAQLFVTDGRLRAETNSEQRAAAVQRRLEEACGGLIRHLSREQKDPMQLPPLKPRATEHTEEEQQVLRDFKQQYYRKWLDEPIPALQGKTPRQAARSRAGRKELDLLLRDIENREAAMPEGTRFDVAIIRDELGL